MENSRIQTISHRDITPRKSTCRNLFGEVDHEQTKKELQLQCKKLLEQKSEHWNFNFEEYIPGEDKNGFQWVPSNSKLSEYNYNPGQSLIGSFTTNVLPSSNMESTKNTTVEASVIEDCQITKTVMGCQKVSNKSLTFSKTINSTKMCGKKKKHQQTIDGKKFQKFLLKV